MRPGEGAPDVAEQLAGNQFLGHRPAVEGDERLRRGRGALAVNGSGEKLLAGAGLALDQDGRAAAGQSAGAVDGCPYRNAGADDPGEAVAGGVRFVPDGAGLGGAAGLGRE